MSTNIKKTEPLLPLQNLYENKEENKRIKKKHS